MVSKKNINLARKDLDDDQRKIIKQATLSFRWIGFIIPSIYLFWARAYGIAILNRIFLIGYVFLLGGGNDLIVRFLEICMVGMRILILIQGSKWAFNNSQGRLKNLV